MTLAHISVLMPTFEHEHFIARAIRSLQAQSTEDWELIIVDDGSSYDLPTALAPYLSDPRIHYHRLEQNQGVGAALNYGLEQAQGEFIAYLPSDDIYHRNHLDSLCGLLDSVPTAVLAYSGVRHHYNRTSPEAIDDHSLQMVQVMHRKTADRWIEREMLVTDDLHRMFWHKLEPRGEFIGTGTVTCEWVDHPNQLHKLIREPVGGINPFRVRFKIQHPLRFHTSVGNLIDEVAHYRRFRERPDTPMTADGLKILLVGELAYNAERVLAMEERGHKLYGLWMRDPYWYNAVGPQPFGHVQDIPYDNWIEEVKRIQPDVIYALLNWQAVPFAHEILMHNPGVPFVWHFKEGPFICLEKGTWSQLIDLHTKSDGQIYTSSEMFEWYKTLVRIDPDPDRVLIFDGDLPKQDWFTDERQPLLSEQDGHLHTVVPGRPIGLHPQNVVEMADQKIHLHFYGDFTHGQWKSWIEKTMLMAPGFLHMHAQVDQNHWVSEFSQYDAGWLHFFQSDNQGDLHNANWDDLNYPARIATLAVAGLPMIQRDNSGHIVATQSLAQAMNLSIFSPSIAELGVHLRQHGADVRESVWQQRQQFTFDYHADRLIDFFRKIINKQGCMHAEEAR